MVVHEHELVRRDRVGRRVDVDERPARVREVHRASRQTRDRISQAHPRMEILRVGLADGVREIEEDVPGELVSLVRAALAEEVGDEGEELDRQRRGANEHVALAADVDRAVRGIALQRVEVARDDLFGLSERLYATELGAVDYITKPFELDELLTRVRSLLPAAD